MEVLVILSFLDLLLIFDSFLFEHFICLQVRLDNSHIYWSFLCIFMRYLQEICASLCPLLKPRQICAAIVSKLAIHTNFYLQAPLKGILLVRELTRSQFIDSRCAPMT